MKSKKTAMTHNKNEKIMNNIFKAAVILIISLLVNINANAQNISQEESEKQSKIDFEILLENIPNTSTYDSDQMRKKYDSNDRSRTFGQYISTQSEIIFMGKTSHFKNDILLINQFDLHKGIAFKDVYNVGDKIYVWKEGHGKSYPNGNNMKEYIQCEELVNIYPFIDLNKDAYLVFEYKTNLNDIQFKYAVVKYSEYIIRMKILNKSIELQQKIANQEFKYTYNNVSGLRGTCVKNIFKRLDFFVVTTDSSDNKIKEETKKMSKKWMIDNGYYDMPTYYEKEFKSKAINISRDYHNITFELDSIKFYHLDVVSLLHSGILKDSLKTYWGKKPFAASNYVDLRSGIITSPKVGEKSLGNGYNLYNATEIDKMSYVDYWENVIPKDEELKKFLTESYTRPALRVSIEKYMNNSEIDSSEFNFSEIVYDYQYKGKYNADKYFYSSTDVRTLRNDVMNFLAEEFCNKRELMNKGKKQEEKKEKYKNDLAKKYGLKYAEAALVGDIIIGMPEDLLTIPLRAWNIDSSSKWEGGYTIYCKFKFNTAKRIVVTVRGGKVSRIANW